MEIPEDERANYDDKSFCVIPNVDGSQGKMHYAI